VTVLQKTMKPQGFNLGMNLEKVSGAGVADHLHVHIVPRWTGDTNFMPVVNDTKLISVALKDVYEQLKEEFQKVKP